jgi:hypothetical protein
VDLHRERTGREHPLLAGVAQPVRAAQPLVAAQQDPEALGDVADRRARRHLERLVQHGRGRLRGIRQPLRDVELPDGQRPRDAAPALEPHRHRGQPNELHHRALPRYPTASPPGPETH